MDLWTDPNSWPFMVVTAHWIQVVYKETVHGTHYKLVLRSDLIGFHRIPARHTGEHMATAFLHLLDRIAITEKARIQTFLYAFLLQFKYNLLQIGWITMDNASNNDTFAEVLEQELKSRQIPFNRFERRIRCAFSLKKIRFLIAKNRCFPHIVNLACKAVLQAMTKLDFAAETAADYIPTAASPETFIEALVSRDPIAILQSLIRSVSTIYLFSAHSSVILLDSCFFFAKAPF